MLEPTPTVLVPGLACSARLYADQIPLLWRYGPVIVADHTRDDSLPAIAGRILAAAPPRFALIGLSMGGYIAFEIMRQEASRVAGLALLDTSARADRPEQSEMRARRIAMAQKGGFAAVIDELFPDFVHQTRRGDAVLRRQVELMAEDTGPEAFVRQQMAIQVRPDARPELAAIRCPTTVLVGDGDVLTTPELAREIVERIPGARLVVIPQCGHLSTIERPHEVNAALAEWMVTLAC